MYNELKELIKNSYSNMSNYKVACIIKMKDGTLYKGVNIENPSFKDGMCAEQVAIGSAISDGYKEKDFDKIYLLGSNISSITPCFLCRQLLIEFFDKDSLVVSYNVDGKETIYKISDLCPFPFSKENLNDK